jgi:hypothetical protein
MVPSGVQAKVTSAPTTLIAASESRRHSIGRISFLQPSHTIVTGIEFNSV